MASGIVISEADLLEPKIAQPGQIATREVSNIDTIVSCVLRFLEFSDTKRSMSIAFETIPFDPGQSFRLVRWEDNVRDIELCLPGSQTRKLRGAGEAWHFHPEIELALITRGRGRRFVGDHVATFEAPDLVLIGSNLPHYWSGLTGSSGFALQFVADRGHPLWQLAETAPLRSLHAFAERGAWLTGPIISEIETLMRRLAEGDDTQGLVRFIEILSKVTTDQRLQTTPLSSTRFSLVDRDPHLAEISRAVTYVLGRIHEEVRLEDLLEVTGMSKPTFCRQFKRHTGRTLIAFVNQVRVDYAKQLLIETNQPITHIAFESGFSNLSHFNRQFRRICGCAPRAYRQQNAGPPAPLARPGTVAVLETNRPVPDGGSNSAPRGLLR